MIPTEEKITETGSLPGKETYATIGDPRMVMKSLTKLYSNTALATIREYSTNARDSNIEAGRADVPIKVTLPTEMNPYFEVEDTGIGLSAERLEEIYISYGTSTKRESNDFNGMLGYGSKSALAYTNSFTVTAVKDGIMTIGVITRKPDYSVVMKIVTSKKTDKPNGVKIRVPVSDVDFFNSVARDFYRFWIPGTVLVNGEETSQAVGEKIDEGLYYSNSGRSYVVMGNVGYRIENPDPLFTNKKLKAVSFIAYVPNGSVEFTPSREDLEYSDATLETLNGVVSKWEKKMLEQAKKEIDQEKDAWRAYAKWNEWVERLGIGALKDVEFDGTKISNEIKLTRTAQRYKPDTWTRQKVEYLHHNSFSLNVDDVNRNRVVLVHSMSTFNLSSVHKSNATKYANHIGSPCRVFIFTEEVIDNKWVDPEKCIAYKDMAAQLPKAPRRTVVGEYECYTLDYKYSIHMKVPDKGEVFWLSTERVKSLNMRHIISEQKKNFPDGLTIVKLPINRQAKFLRENPDVKNFDDHLLDGLVLDGVPLLSPKEKQWLDYRASVHSQILDRFAPYKKNILDPEIVKFCDILGEKHPMTKYNSALSEAVSLGKGSSFKKYVPTSPKIDLLQKYPLLSNFSYYRSSDMNHWVDYMNMVYERNQI